MVIWTRVVEVEGKWTKPRDTEDKILIVEEGLNGVREWEAARMTPGFWTNRMEGGSEVGKTG